MLCCYQIRSGEYFCLCPASLLSYHIISHIPCHMTMTLWFLINPGTRPTSGIDPVIGVRLQLVPVKIERVMHSFMIKDRIEFRELHKGI